VTTDRTGDTEVALEGSTMASNIYRANTPGEGISLTRRRAGLSRDELAARIGIGTGSLGRLESDTSTKIDLTVIRKITDELADALDLDREEMFTGMLDVIRRSVASDIRIAIEVEGLVSGRRRPRRS